jgi:hypothetical protein
MAAIELDRETDIEWWNPLPEAASPWLRRMPRLAGRVVPEAATGSLLVRRRVIGAIALLAAIDSPGFPALGMTTISGACADSWATLATGFGSGMVTGAVIVAGVPPTLPLSAWEGWSDR